MDRPGRIDGPRWGQQEAKVLEGCLTRRTERDRGTVGWRVGSRRSRWLRWPRRCRRFALGGASLRPTGARAEQRLARMKSDCDATQTRSNAPPVVSCLHPAGSIRTSDWRTLRGRVREPFPFRPTKAARLHIRHGSRYLLYASWVQKVHCMSWHSLHTIDHHHRRSSRPHPDTASTS